MADGGLDVSLDVFDEDRDIGRRPSLIARDVTTSSPGRLPKKIN